MKLFKINVDLLLVSWIPIQEALPSIHDTIDNLTLTPMQEASMIWDQVRHVSDGDPGGTVWLSCLTAGLTKPSSLVRESGMQWTFDGKRIF